MMFLLARRLLGLVVTLDVVILGVGAEEATLMALRAASAPVLF